MQGLSKQNVSWLPLIIVYYDAKCLQCGAGCAHPGESEPFSWPTQIMCMGCSEMCISIEIHQCLGSVL